MALYGNLPLTSITERHRHDESIARCFNCGELMIYHWLIEEGGKRRLSREWR